MPTAPSERVDHHGPNASRMLDARSAAVRKIFSFKISRSVDAAAAAPASLGSGGSPLAAEAAAVDSAAMSDKHSTAVQNVQLDLTAEVAKGRCRFASPYDAHMVFMIAGGEQDKTENAGQRSRRQLSRCG